jgi:16S rRNA (uracil1498-N3)-methyltransferase
VAHFYLVDSLENADSVELLGAEARHAATVARIRVGESTTVGDGRGSTAVAEVVALAPGVVSLRVGAVTRVPPPDPRIWLVQALAKGDRDELAIQAATELGVAVVAPWQAERSIARWTGEKAVRGAARWADIVREAGKQAMRPWAVETLGLQTTSDLERIAAAHPTVLLDPDSADRLVDVVPPDARGDLVLIVGPEGGISPAETARLVAAGARTARMGPAVLRTSTAGPAALAALAVRLDLWP